MEASPETASPETAPAGTAPADDEALAIRRAWHKEKIYWLVALVLGVITAIEVSTYTSPDVWGDAAVPSLLFMMAVKFFLVTWFFMHLKGDWNKGHRILTYVFYFGLVLAAAVYLATMAAMRFF
jgi:heme/copper-type cytochrome/quinol oxidase subunit 4